MPRRVGPLLCPGPSSFQILPERQEPGYRIQGPFPPPWFPPAEAWPARPLPAHLVFPSLPVPVPVRALRTPLAGSRLRLVSPVWFPPEPLRESFLPVRWAVGPQRELQPPGRRPRERQRPEQQRLVLLAARAPPALVWVSLPWPPAWLPLVRLAEPLPWREPRWLCWLRAFPIHSIFVPRPRGRRPGPGCRPPGRK